MTVTTLTIVSTCTGGLQFGNSIFVVSQFVLDLERKVEGNGATPALDHVADTQVHGIVQFIVVSNVFTCASVISAAALKKAAR